MADTAESESLPGSHAVMALIAERLAAGSGPGDRGDGHRLALAIEGGGMRGTITAGMALAVYELGLTRVFDAVYGSSAGAISGAWLCSSNPPGVRVWHASGLTDTLIRRGNLLRPGRPVLDVETLIEQVYPRIMDFDSVLGSPIPLHVLATDVDTGESVDLRHLLTSARKLRLAIRASCALPVLAGPPVEIDGHRYVDSGLSESIPYRTALAQGATHVLVLSSRRAEDVVRSSWSRGSRLVAATVLRRHPAALRRTFLTRNERLAADDAVLRASGDEIFSVRPAADSPRVSGTEADEGVLRAAFEAGRAAVFTAFGTPAPETAPGGRVAAY